MIEACALLLLCQLAGETAVRFVHAPVPGPVAGMALLLAILAVRGRVPDAVGDTADTILRNMSLMFVPAGVGIVQQYGLLADSGLKLAVVLVVSTVIAMVVTGRVFQALARRAEPGPPPAPGPEAAA
ncbi:CidA/LrgA family protein [Blastochloris viridis]|uniref:Antiholin-like protein LrgA n=1 Tax=Blastochloris viridis TaxID=1079 RepID=A0A0H5BNH8_BLAVI|nr:CidA/LrgA family protein [Blastochloris viridis]ALK08875.1 Antiholin-like protein LrgA [Blastochloris viridis]BAR97823.1 antiholin-like protein LrgA [Blastochloris viridis]CUU41536.1 Antiholin-like protein LrgA [Blastochloris viridis]